VSGRKSKFIAYGLLFAAVFLMLFIHPDFFTPFKFSVLKVVNIPIRIIAIPLNEIKKALTYHRTYNDYRRLRLEYSILRERIIGMDEIIKENNRLAKLLEFKRRLVFSSIAASVIGRDPSSWNSVIVIDRGRDHGVEQGMAVVSALGVVGKIAETSADRSKVVLLTDPEFAVAALVKRSREVGLVTGTLQGMSQMRYLSGGADVQAGDIVITSKLSSSFPEGLLIGEVTEVYTDKNSSAVNCIIRPAASLSQLEEVLVVHQR
jgi:rod shape-determining protein MreC